MVLTQRYSHQSRPMAVAELFLAECTRRAHVLVVDCDEAKVAASQRCVAGVHPSLVQSEWGVELVCAE